MAGGGGSVRLEGKCLCLTSPCVQGVFLPTNQSSGSSGLWALPWLLAHVPSRGREQGARTSLWKASEWKFLLLIHVGEGSCPARKETAGKQLEHPTSIRPMFVMRLARVRPAGPPFLFSHQMSTLLSTLTQRRERRPKEVARREAGQAPGLCACHFLSEPASWSVRWGSLS